VGDLPSTASGPPQDRSQLRVASVPATHVYVERLAHPDVVPPDGPSGTTCAPPCFLDPAWLEDNADRFDLMHIHFGFEFYGDDRLAAVCDALGRTGRPLVYTCHDLRNPNHPTSEVHDRHLDVLLERADHVITLTNCAARRIREPWGREATVLPHPHVVPLDELRRRQARPRPQHGDGFRVGIHFKSLRPNMSTLPVVEGALTAAHGVDSLGAARGVP
jgi:hypothetical protein